MKCKTIDFQLKVLRIQVRMMKNRKYIVTLVINTTNTIFENNLPLIEDLIEVTTILKEELNTKNFDINLKNKSGTRNTKLVIIKRN